MATNKLAYHLELISLDWGRLTVLGDTNENLFFKFPIEPKDYLAFARKDFEEGGLRGLVNAVSNAKRAIDCQVDGYLTALGFALKKSELRRQLGKDLADAIERDTDVSKTVPLGFRLLQTLGFSSLTAVEGARQLRNSYEHEYRRPNKTRVVNVLNIAELFVAATAPYLSDNSLRFSLGSGQGSGDHNFAKEIYCAFHSQPTPRFEVHFWDRTKRDSEGGRSPCVRVEPHYPSYYWLLRIGFSGTLDQPLIAPIRGFLRACGANVPINRVRAVGRF